MKTKKKYQDGGMTGFEKRQAKKVGRAQTRAAVASIEGEGTVAQKRDNRASRVSTMAGTARAKTPKSVSTSTSTSNSTSTVNNNRPSGMAKTAPENMKTISKTASKPSVPAGKPKPEYMKASVKTAPKDSIKSPVRYQKGGQTSQAVAKKIVKGVKSDVKTAIKTPYNVMKSVDDTLEKRYPNYTKPGGTYDMIKKGIKSVFQNGGTVKPAAKKPAVKKATPPRSTMDMIRGSKKSDYTGTVTQAAKRGGIVKRKK